MTFENLYNFLSRCLSLLANLWIDIINFMTTNIGGSVADFLGFDLTPLDMVFGASFTIILGYLIINALVT